MSRRDSLTWLAFSGGSNSDVCEVAYHLRTPIWRALRQAGGKWQGRGREYQADVPVEYRLDGWVTY